MPQCCKKSSIKFGSPPRQESSIRDDPCSEYLTPPRQKSSIRDDPCSEYLTPTRQESSTRDDSCSEYLTPKKKRPTSDAKSSPSRLVVNIGPGAAAITARKLSFGRRVGITRLTRLKYQEKYDALSAALERDVQKYNQNIQEHDKPDSSGVTFKELCEDDSIECKLFSCYHTGRASHVTAAMKSCINLLNDVKEESIAEVAPERDFAELFMRLYRVIILYKYRKQYDFQANKSTDSTALGKLQGKITTDSAQNKLLFKDFILTRTQFLSQDNKNSRRSQLSDQLILDHDNAVFYNDLFLAKYFLDSSGRFNCPYKTLALDEHDANVSFLDQGFGVTVMPKTTDPCYLNTTGDHLLAVMALDQMPVGQLKAFDGDGRLVCSRTIKITGPSPSYYSAVPKEKYNENALTVWSGHPASCVDKNQYIIKFDNSSKPFCETSCTLRKKLLIGLQNKIAENSCIYADVTVDNIGMVDGAVRIRDDKALEKTDDLSDDVTFEFPRSTPAGADRYGHDSLLSKEQHESYSKSEYIKISKIISVVQSVLTIYNIQPGHETARLYDMLFAQMYERLRSDLHCIDEQSINPAELIDQLCVDINNFYDISDKRSTADAIKKIEEYHWQEMKQHYGEKEGCSEFTLIAGDAECDSEILQALRGNQIKRNFSSENEKYNVHDGNAGFWTNHADKNHDTTEKFKHCHSNYDLLTLITRNPTIVANELMKSGCGDDMSPVLNVLHNLDKNAPDKCFDGLDGCYYTGALVQGSLFSDDSAESSAATSILECLLSGGGNGKNLLSVVLDAFIPVDLSISSSEDGLNSEYERKGMVCYQKYILKKQNPLLSGIKFANPYALKAAKELFEYIGLRTNIDDDKWRFFSHQHHRAFYNTKNDNSLQSKKQLLVCTCLDSLQECDENSSENDVRRRLLNIIDNEIVDKREVSVLNTLFGGCTGRKTRLRKCLDSIVGTFKSLASDADYEAAATGVVKYVAPSR